MSASGGPYPPFQGNQGATPPPNRWAQQGTQMPRPQQNYPNGGQFAANPNPSPQFQPYQPGMPPSRSSRGTRGALIALSIVLGLLVVLIAGGAIAARLALREPSLDKQWQKIQKAAPSDQIISAFFNETKYADRTSLSLSVTYLVDGKRVEVRGYDGKADESKELRTDDIFGPAEKVDVQKFVDVLKAPENQCPGERQLTGWLTAREQGSIIKLGCDKTGVSGRAYDIKLVDIGGHQLDLNPGVDAALDGVLALAKISFPDEVTALQWMPGSDVTWTTDYVSVVGPKIGTKQRIESILIDDMVVVDQALLTSAEYDEPFKLADLDVDKAKATWNYLADLKGVQLATSRGVVYKYEGQLVYGILWGKINPSTGAMPHAIWVDGDGNVVFEK